MYEIIRIGSRAQDITGKKFGRLTAIAPIRRAPYSNIVWLCICECGTEKEAVLSDLNKGHYLSCGCYKIECISKSKTTHGMSNSAEFNIWQGIKERCNNKKAANYHRYGGRGIKICERWENDFSAFYEDMGSRPSSKHSIDRIDNNGDYVKPNCRWTTKKVQSNNRNNNKRLEYCGETRTVQEWCDKYKVNRSTFVSRLKRGLSVGESLFTAIKK
jgi:hypothetical protein